MEVERPCRYQSKPVHIDTENMMRNLLICIQQEDLIKSENCRHRNTRVRSFKHELNQVDLIKSLKQALKHSVAQKLFKYHRNSIIDIHDFQAVAVKCSGPACQDNASRYWQLSHLNSTFTDKLPILLSRSQINLHCLHIGSRTYEWETQYNNKGVTKRK